MVANDRTGTDTVSDNRRAEYCSLREEIYRSDRTCLTLMGFLLAVTGTVGAAFFDRSSVFVGWLLSPIWVIGFCYFTEKRFVIGRNAAYIRDRIERNETGLGWESHLRQLARSGNMRRALPLDPYHLELISCGLVTGGIPWLGLWRDCWGVVSVPFASSLALFLLFLYLAGRALREYGNPQTYDTGKCEQRGATSSFNDDKTMSEGGADPP